ncbi:glycosyltransferase family 2 protein [Paenibacillus hexagrammi]|uniref:Glycosyltransferase n=1 Tax=Paenibacillus hexagrammi TaxID=2908839 RepID=A0ABY3SFV3_9BACL|nr:glycosyltransferase [Paenibacillus sp. YPD9-1]UJF32124.1 glycosyltransferase [Paenibacillus sp. YPD9-1]
MVTIIACTMRPAFMENLFRNYARQKHVNKEMIVILNRDDMNLEVWRNKAKEYSNVRVYKVPQSYKLGKCLNFAIKRAKYDVIAKFDDDDYYAPHYLIESVEAMKRTHADIVGKSASFIYFEESKSLMVLRPRDENRFTKHMKGGTLVFKKRVWDRIKFSQSRVSGSDAQFLRMSRKAGFKLYTVSRYNYVCIRRRDISSHTQKTSTAKYMKKCKFICHTDHYIRRIRKKMV